MKRWFTPCIKKDKKSMIELNMMRGISFSALICKLLLSILLGGLLGLEREKKGYPAGIRTHMLVCIGAALTMILGQYEAVLIQSGMIGDVGFKVDTSRFGAQVINGIGFLGAGTILVNGRKEVKGLTTATGLWAAGCLGLVIGSGFYEGALGSFFCIFLSVTVFKRLEQWMLSRIKIMNLYMEFDSLTDIPEIVRSIQEQKITILDMEVMGGEDRRGRRGAKGNFLLKITEKMEHVEVLDHLSEIMGVRKVDEL